MSTTPARTCASSWTALASNMSEPLIMHVETQRSAPSINRSAFSQMCVSIHDLALMMSSVLWLGLASNLSSMGSCGGYDVETSFELVLCIANHFTLVASGEFVEWPTDNNMPGVVVRRAFCKLSDWCISTLFLS